MMKLIATVFILMGIISLSAMSEAKNVKLYAVSEAVKDAAFFDEGYLFFEKKEFERAVPLFYHFLSVNTPDDENYDWAQFFLGISLNKLGYTHASVDLLGNLVLRNPNPKMVLYSLELFDEISRTLPFDNDLIIDELISSREYEFAEGEIVNFVHFYKGLFDWRHGFIEWGDAHFKKISPESYYYYRYLYEKTLYDVYRNRIDDALITLNEILESPLSFPNLKDDARSTMARLLYEKGEFDNSVQLYEDVEKPMLEQGRNLLERAWNQFRMGNNEKAMGLLYAYKAPSFRQYFTPEYFLLKSLIYKNLCHYEKALTIVSEFQNQYQSSLDHIYGRGEAIDDGPLLLMLLTKKGIKNKWDFIQLLEEEKKNIERFDDEEFKAYLEDIYALQLRETSDGFRTLVKSEYEKMADRLLRYEEEAYLMEYEIGLDMSQRVYENHYSREVVAKEKDSVRREVRFPFQGEFWNDELADYRVSLPDKCNKMEEWDIFFK